MSVRTRRHAGKRRKTPRRKLKRRRNVVLKGNPANETRSVWLWVLLIYQFRRPKSLGEGEMRYVCVRVLLKWGALAKAFEGLMIFSTEESREWMH